MDSSSKICILFKDVKKIVIIGVHGWFPTGLLLKTVFGEPLGTSFRFTEKMQQALKEFFYNRYNIELDAHQITRIPLVGEGKILERVDLFLNYLESKWKNEIQSADLILVAAHSRILLFQ